MASSPLPSPSPSPPPSNAPPPSSAPPPGSPPPPANLTPPPAPVANAPPPAPVTNAPPPAPVTNAPPPSPSPNLPTSPPPASTSPPPTPSNISSPSPAPSFSSPPPAPPTSNPPPPPSISSPPPAPLTASPPPPTPPAPATPNTPESPPTQQPPPPPPSVGPPNAPNNPPPSSPTPPAETPPPGLASPPVPSPSPPSLPPPNLVPPVVPSPSPPSPNSPPISVTPPPPSIVSSPPPPPSIAPPNNPPSSGGIGTPGTVAIATAVSVFFLCIFCIVSCCLWKRRKRGSGTSGGHIIPTTVNPSPQSGSHMLAVQVSTSNIGNGSGNIATYSPHDAGGLRNSRLWFTYQDLMDATDGFSTHNLLGEGGFGSVYKGILVDKREVAVKKLKEVKGQGDREFRSEVEIISRVHHRHLVSLVGYCIHEEHRLLVFDYLPNDTLHFHLHGENRPVMDWITRVKIAVGAARGIAYLHEDCHPRIIHRDIKSSNILLDENFEARVSDFGLAKLAMDTNTHITTRVMGTFGYMAPEYATSGKLTEKSDVFSFGVVLLELISGRKPVDTSQPLGEESLVEWARPLLNHALEMEDFGELPDPKLNGNYVDGEMFRLIEAAAACVRRSATKRPTMGQVVRAFDSMATSDLTNGMRVGEREVFNSAQQSAEIRLFRRMAFGSPNFSTDFSSQTSKQSNAHNFEDSGGRSDKGAETSESSVEKVMG